MYVSIDASEVHALARDIRSHADSAPERVEVAVARTGFRTVAFSQLNAPVDTGALKASIGVDVDGLEFEAGPTVDYGAYVELGTAGPYPIRNPWGWGDDVVVMHPGNAPEPYLGPGFDRAVEVGMDDFADAAGDVW